MFQSLRAVTLTHVKVCKESWASQQAARRYNPARVLVWRYKRRPYRAVLAMGNGDDWDVFETPGKFHERYLVVVSRSTGLGYVGVEVFKAHDPTPDDWDDVTKGPYSATAEWEIFFQNADEAFEGEKWEDWSLRYLAKRLLEWWM